MTSVLNFDKVTVRTGQPVVDEMFRQIGGGVIVSLGMREIVFSPSSFKCKVGRRHYVQIELDPADVYKVTFYHIYKYEVKEDAAHFVFAEDLPSHLLDMAGTFNSF